MVTRQQIMTTARGLLAEGVENPEYDRAIAEMTTELLGLPITDHRAMVLHALRFGPLDDTACEICGERTGQVWAVGWAAACADHIAFAYGEENT